jgi:hypothetical protein
MTVEVLMVVLGDGSVSDAKQRIEVLYLFKKGQWG